MFIGRPKKYLQIPFKTVHAGTQQNEIEKSGRGVFIAQEVEAAAKQASDDFNGVKVPSPEMRGLWCFTFKVHGAAGNSNTGTTKDDRRFEKQ